MRLLNARTYEFHIVLGADKPNYAILSHTWEDGEVLFEDIRDTSKIDWSAKKGYFKIERTCEKALQDGCEFVWIDTCNINKDSSTELSEAINSMFRWYRDATICYAYVSDSKAGDEQSLLNCRWLTRGWTLQEMIAPDRVHFYDMDWRFLGSRISLAKQLSSATGIHESVLLRRHHAGMLQTDLLFIQGSTKHVLASTEYVWMKDTGTRRDSSVSAFLEADCSCCSSTKLEEARSMLDRFSVAQKMKWASKRTTTREEDIAYCLMGLFDVNMPLLYGEGAKAFYRLQKSILGISSDHSILAFRSSLSPGIEIGVSPLLAPCPALFQDEIQNMHMPTCGTHASLSGTTLSIEMLICPLQEALIGDEYLGILDCSMDGDRFTRPAILLSAVHKRKLLFRRSSRNSALFRLHSSHPGEAELVTDRLESRPLWLPFRLHYDSSDIKRARVTIIGEKLVNNDQRHAIAPIRVNISSIFSELGVQIISSPPLVAEHLPDTTRHIGSIAFYSTWGKRFWVSWNQAVYGQLECSISTYLQPGDDGAIQEQTVPRVNLELESRDACVTTPLTELRQSDRIVLKHPTSLLLKVWISISKETFIGRNRFELNIQGRLIDPETEKERQMQRKYKRYMENPNALEFQSLSLTEDG